jgi:hypothetical protein
MCPEQNVVWAVFHGFYFSGRNLNFNVRTSKITYFSFRQESYEIELPAHSNWISFFVTLFVEFFLSVILIGLKKEKI